MSDKTKIIFGALSVRWRGKVKLYSYEFRMCFRIHLKLFKVNAKNLSVREPILNLLA